MNRAGHITSGLAAGVAVVALRDPTPTLGAFCIAGMSTGAAALLPDLDHLSSTVTRHLGPITRALSWVLRWISATVYRFTKGPRDEDVTGKHRHFSHTFLFAGLLGSGVSALCAQAAAYHPLAGVAAVVLIVTGLTSLATTYFGTLALTAPAALALAVYSSGDPVTALNAAGPDLGWYIGIGCAVHCLGDALTEQGCPFLYPLPWRGETFYEWRPPALLRFRTGGPVEAVLVALFLAAAVGTVTYQLQPDLIEWLLDLALEYIRSHFSEVAP